MKVTSSASSRKGLASAWQFYLGGLRGACLILAVESVYLSEQQITHDLGLASVWQLCCVPVQLNELLNERLQAISPQLLTQTCTQVLCPAKSCILA